MRAKYKTKEEAMKKSMEMGQRLSVLELSETDLEHAESDLLKVQKLESIGTLEVGIAHDFNNLLTEVLGNISLAKRHINSDDKINKRLGEAEKACFRARDFTQQLLIFSKAERPVKKVVWSLGNFIKERVNSAVNGSKARCECIDEELWLVEIDEGQISLVINNLIKIAEKSIPQVGSIKVENVVLGKQKNSLKTGKICKANGRG